MPKLLKYLFIPVFLITLAGCERSSYGILADIDSFEPITEELVFQEVQPGAEVQYWEYGWLSWPFDSATVYQQAGTKCLGASDPLSCAIAFDTLVTDELGLLRHFGGISFIRYQDSLLQNFTVGNANELIQFLDVIDSRSDAILMAYAYNFNFERDLEAGGIKKVTDGYELLMSRMTKDCAPIVVRRYHLHIGSNGDLRILGSEVYHEDADACV